MLKVRLKTVAAKYVFFIQAQHIRLRAGRLYRFIPVLTVGKGGDIYG